MAVTEIHQAVRPGPVRRTLATIAAAFTALLEAQSRQDELERLRAKSDADLAAMGLTRDQIPEYVFRDFIHL